jgi:ankyrin repeat protein
MSAAMPGGDVRVVELLLARGADVNAANPQNGYTALMGAAGEGSYDLVSALVKAGADLHAKNKWGETALSIAIKSGQKNTAWLLRQAGARY